VRWDNGATTMLTTGGPDSSGGARAIDNAGELFGAVVTDAENESSLFVKGFWGRFLRPS
jgi:hypothetical protein